MQVEKLHNHHRFGVEEECQPTNRRKEQSEIDDSLGVCCVGCVALGNGNCNYRSSREWNVAAWINYILWFQNLVLEVRDVCAVWKDEHEGVVINLNWSNT